MATKGRRDGHAGVVIYRRKDTDIPMWLAEWIDPDSGKRKRASLYGQGCTSRVQAVEWARAKSRELAEMKQRVSVSGRRAQVEVDFADVFTAYIGAFAADHGEKAAKRTERDWLCRWRAFLADRRVRTGGMLGVEHLEAFRQSLASGESPLAPTTRNRHLTAVKAMLAWARRLHYIRLTSDDLREGLKLYKCEQRLPEVLKRPQLVSLLDGLVKHDNSRFYASRHDKAAYYLEQPSDSASTRYEPLAPFVLLAMLTGARPGEVWALRWEDVDFAAGEIRVWGSKTQRQRAVPLQDSPLLSSLLSALKLQAGANVYVCGDNGKGGPRCLRRSAWSRLVALAELKGTRPKVLRATCVSHVANGSPYSEAALELRFGHSADVSKRHYREQLNGLNTKSATVEGWLGIEKELTGALVALGLVVQTFALTEAAA